jgi:hypothetical protein
MKTLLVAAVTAFALAGTGMVSAQTSGDANVKLHSSGGVDANAKTTIHKRKYRATTGRGGIETRDNNASARGSLLPGKDRLNSESFIKDKN